MLKAPAQLSSQAALSRVCTEELQCSREFARMHSKACTAHPRQCCCCCSTGTQLHAAVALLLLQELCTMCFARAL